MLGPVVRPAGRRSASTTGAAGEPSEGRRVRVSGTIIGAPDQLTDGVGVTLDDGSGTVRAVIGPVAVGDFDPRIRDGCHDQRPAGPTGQLRDRRGRIPHPRDPGRRARSGARTDTESDAHADRHRDANAGADTDRDADTDPGPDRGADCRPRAVCVADARSDVDSVDDPARRCPGVCRSERTVRTSGVVTAEEGRLGTHVPVGDR